jgi:flagellar motor component MotA
MNLRKVFAAALVLGMFGAAIVMGAPFIIFIDAGPILIVLGVLGCGLLGAYSWADLGWLEGVHVGSERLDEASSAKARAMFSRAGDLALGAGFLGMLIGLVQMLSNLDDPTAIGPAMAVALLSAFYGIFLGQIVFRAATTDCFVRSTPRAENALQGMTFRVRELSALGLGAAVVVLVLLMKGSLLIYLNLPSIILLLGGTLGALLWSFSPADMSRVCRAYFGPDDLEKEDAILGYTLLTHLGELAIAVGLIGTLVGLVQMLQSLDDPTKIGPALAVALLVTFYAVAISEVFCRPMAGNFLARGKVLEDVGQHRATLRLYVSLGMVFILLCTFFIMLLAMCPWNAPEACAEPSETAEYIEANSGP